MGKDRSKDVTGQRPIPGFEAEQLSPEEVSEARHESAAVAGASEPPAQRCKGLARANECKQVGQTGQLPNRQEGGFENTIEELVRPDRPVRGASKRPLGGERHAKQSEKPKERGTLLSADCASLQAHLTQGSAEPVEKGLKILGNQKPERAPNGQELAAMDGEESCKPEGLRAGCEQQLVGTGQAPNGQELGGKGQAPNGQELGGKGQAPNQQELGGKGQAPNGQELGGKGQAPNQQEPYRPTLRISRATSAPSSIAPTAFVDAQRSGLNPPQLEACVHDGPSLLILAGAGSGKTRVITYRIAHLIADRGLPPDRILAVTFTNKAAGEMRERSLALLQQAGVPTQRPPEIGTFHAVCARILRRYAPALGLNNRFSIYDEADQASMLKRCAEELHLPSEAAAVREWVHALSRFKDENLSVRDVFEAAIRAREEQLARVYERYTLRMREANAVDFGDLIMLVLQLLQQHDPDGEPPPREQVSHGDRADSSGRPRRPHELTRRWRHILVDEFQDTNLAQYQLLRALCGHHLGEPQSSDDAATQAGVTVVGDDDQSIYAWRGANFRNVLRFPDDFPDTKVVKLEQNYRSTQSILNLASDLIAQNDERMPKRLWTEQSGGEAVRIVAARDDIDEARFVCRQMRLLHEEQGLPYEQQAVFFRINAQARLLEEYLRAVDVPYQIFGGVSFYQRAEIKDVLGYLHVIVNPDDSVAWRRILNVPPRGLGAKTMAAIEAFTQEHQLSIHQVLDAIAHGKLSTGKARADLVIADLLGMLEELREGLEARSPSSVLQHMLESTKYLTYLRARSGDRADDTEQNVAELVRAVQDFESGKELLGPQGADPSLQQERILPAFLERISLIPSPESGEEGGAKLMTIHAAKGLEFDTVFVVGVEEQLLPYQRREEVPDIPEERRLCYVAFTRARKRLYLSFTRYRRIHGFERPAVPSRFLRGLDERDIEWLGDARRAVLGRLVASAPEPRRFRAEQEPVYELDGPRPGPRLRPPAQAKPPTWAYAEARATPAEAQPQAEIDEEPVVVREDLGPAMQPAKDARAADGRFSVGDVVSHRELGVGEVVAARDSGREQVLSVFFPAHGEKKIVSRFVRRFG
ncbi:MAG: 3'-5' exonuclease [Myxococcota bacterium]|nr:3'-5' exonuclease [Myxococcota bacterium]